MVTPRTLATVAVGAAALAVAPSAAPTEDAITIATDKAVIALRLDRDGGRVHFAGAVGGARTGTWVTLEANPCGSGWYDADGTTTTGSAWRIDRLVEIGTAFRARGGGSTSRVLRIAARPSVSLERGTSGWWLVRVYALRSFVGHTAKVERRTADGRWIRVRRVRLTRRDYGGETSGAFRAPRLRGPVRAVLPRSQAGRCYLAGYSLTTTAAGAPITAWRPAPSG